MNKPDYSTENPEEMVDSLNTVLDSGLLLGSNMNGQIIENITLPVGVEVAISHNLKSVPKYRIILRQTGGLVITDGVKAWDDKKIYLKAEDASGVFTSNFYAHSYHVGSGFDANIESLVTAANLNASFNTAYNEATITIILMRG